MIDAEQVSRRLLEDEGFVATAYYDSEGYLTIGPGILIDERRKGSGISVTEGMYLLMNRIHQIENECRLAFTWFDQLNPARQQIIVCMAYQLGVRGVANFKRMVAAIRRLDFSGAAFEMMSSRWAQQTPGRAKRMANMMERGEWIEPAQISGG